MNDKARSLTNDLEVMRNVDHTIDTWQLWSWQTANIELTEYAVDHRKSPWVDCYSQYPELCEMLSKLIGTNQFIWCDTQDGEAWKDREKWELSVPKDRVRLICSITWNWILSRSNGKTSRCRIPDRLWYLSQLEYNEFQNRFHDAWKDKKPEELWDMLSVNEIGECTHALVLCPIEEDWIIRRPS